MARGPDGKGVGAGFSLADHLFNAKSIGILGHAHVGVKGFDADRFQAEALSDLEGRTLLDRLDWIATCLGAQLPAHFPDMADALLGCMPPELDLAKTDDDFGLFIHAVPGILAVRHGLEAHRERALDLLYESTKRFSMEFYIRPFLNRWPEQTLARLDEWARDDNYHVRRLVSEGTRPSLPWAGKIALDPSVPLRFLNQLHGDGTRYVTRSVANHMNDLSKVMPDQVVEMLSSWQSAGQQTPKELDWMTRHALRTAVKRGERGALDLLGYRTGQISAKLSLPRYVKIGEALEISLDLTSDEALPVMVDYRLRFHRPTKPAEKVFKLKTGSLKPGTPQRFAKSHKLKANASTFTLHPGPHHLTVQVNGQDVADAAFEVMDA